MAEPTLELDASITTASTTYDKPIINAGSPVANIVIRWGAADSADGAITNVQRPASGDKWAEELWYEDTGGTDFLITDSDEDPEAGSPRPMMFQISSSDDVAFATAPRITVFDDNTYTHAEEFIEGTAGHGSPYVKARGQNVNTAPPQYWGETDGDTLHTLDNLTSIVCGNQTSNEENCALHGFTAYIYTSALNIYTPNEEYFSLALSLPSDATVGVDAIDGVLTVRYTYT